MNASLYSWICRHYRRLRPFIFLIPCVGLPLFFGATWISSVSLLLGLLLFSVFVWNIQPRHYEPAWQEVAQKAGLEFMTRTKEAGAYVMGVINGRKLNLTAQNPLPSLSQTPQTRLAIDLNGEQIHSFTLTSTNKRERDARKLYNLNNGIGILELDELFTFKNQTDHPIAPLFTDALTQQLARIGHSETDQTIELTPTQIIYTAQSILLNQQTLIFLIGLMGELADRVEMNHHE
ncbi:MAG: hypothetical protein AAF490_13940 [Chloroflexota bacterium]